MPDVAIPTRTFTPAENATGRPTDATVDDVVAQFTTHGAVRLHDVFTPTLRQDLREHFLRGYRAQLRGTSKADRRPLYTVAMRGPFGEPDFYANPLLLPILRRLLGADLSLGAVSAVISFPGAPQQFIHRDSPWLFADAGVDVALPAYAITVLMPMVDADAKTGSTRVWPGTHRVADLDAAQLGPSASPDVPHGSVLMTDSRVVHAGSPNVSDRVRPLLYCTYHRSWFRDWGGYNHRPAVSIDRAARAKVPAEFAHLFRIADEADGQPEGPLSLRQRAHALFGTGLR